MKHQNSVFREGAIAKVTFLSVLRHYGIYDGAGRVITSSPWLGCVTEQSLQEFSGGSQILWEYPGGDDLPGVVVVQNARRCLGKRWTPRYNCEHFARGCHGKEISYQLNRAIATAIAGLMLCVCVPTLRRGT
jgi:hypothetical protein